KALIAQGLRAQLDVASLVTGQLEVALNFYPGTPVRLTGLSTESVPEIPTLPSSIEKLSKTLDKLPLDEMIADARQTLDTINKLVNSPEVKATLTSLSRAVANADTLIKNTNTLVVGVNGQVPALMTQVNKTTDSAQATLQSAQATLKEAQAAVARVGGVAENALVQYQQLAAEADAPIDPPMANPHKAAPPAPTTP